jgi:hypothetical protein
VVANSVQKLFPEAPSGALYLFKSSRNLVEAVLRWGTIASSSEPTFLPDACWSLRRGQPHWSERPGTGEGGKVGFPTVLSRNASGHSCV